MLKNKYYNEILILYKNVVSEFLKLSSNYNLVTYKINEYETVIEIEKAVLFFIGLRENYSSQKEMDLAFSFFGTIEHLYHIIIEELTPNELFKFNATKFTGNFNTNSFHFFNIKKFVGWDNPYGKFNDGSVCAYVDSKLPQLELKKKYDQWEGWIYYFILYELTVDDKKTYCLWYTTNNDLIRTIRKKFPDLYYFCRTRRNNEIFQSHKRNTSDRGLIPGKGFTEFIFSLEKEHNCKFDEDFFRHSIKYYIIDKKIKDTLLLEPMIQNILDDANNSCFEHYEQGSLILPPSKWKSEYLVKELCEKKFGKQNVIYQYRPFFLQTEKGQLSYDIYLIKQKIAIEYQGKQHFTPVEYFGGEEAFHRQKARDSIKKKLSEKNGIKLVYINYWETINMELIEKKIYE